MCGRSASPYSTVATAAIRTRRNSPLFSQFATLLYVLVVATTVSLGVADYNQELNAKYSINHTLNADFDWLPRAPRNAAPAIHEARIAADYNSIEVHFGPNNGHADNALINNTSELCKLLFDDITLDMLGEGPRCSWSNDMVLSIYPGFAHAFRPSEAIYVPPTPVQVKPFYHYTLGLKASRIAPSQFYARYPTSPSKTNYAPAVTLPLLAPFPHLAEEKARFHFDLHASGEISYCSDTIISFINTAGHFNLPIATTWNITSYDDEPGYEDHYHREQLFAIFLSALSPYATGFNISAAHARAFFPIGVPLTVTVTAINWLGVSITKQITLTLRDVPWSPFLLPSDVTIGSGGASISAAQILPQCSEVFESVSLQPYTWQHVSGSPLLGLPSIITASSMNIVPNAMPEGSTSTWVLTREYKAVGRQLILSGKFYYHWIYFFFSLLILLLICLLFYLYSTM